MDITFDALAIFAYLIPGFVSSVLLNLLISREKKDFSEQVIEALVFSFLIYVAIALSTDAAPVVIKKSPEENAIPTTVFNGTLMPLVMLYAVLLPIIISVCQRFDFPAYFLRKFKMTRMISQSNLWTHAFASQSGCWTTVVMKNGDRFYGWPRYYSTLGDNRSLLLHNPHMILPDNKTCKLEAEAMLLLDEDIYYIEFTPDHSANNNQETR